MGKQRPLIKLAGPGSTSAVRADDHLQGPARVHAVLGRQEVQMLNALVLPKRLGTLPPHAKTQDYQNIVGAVANAGLILGLRENARRAGLFDLVRACATLAQRQQFIGRERWNAAKEAARRIREATGRPPTALGALAAAHLVYPSPAARLSAKLRFLVPAANAAEARLAVADIRGVVVSAHALAGGSTRSLDEAVRLRGSALVDEGWQLPTPEDAALLTLGARAHQRGIQRMAALVDLALITGHADFRWDVFAQRCAKWRLRPQTFAALQALKRHFSLETPEAVLKRVEPSPWERLVQHVVG